MTATTTAADTTTATTRRSGRVRWFSPKGFGFIARPGEEDTYVHHSAIVGSGFRTLVAGTAVRFGVRPTPRGPEAVDVVPVDDDRELAADREALDVVLVADDGPGAGSGT